jgi:hypothetical protein
VGGGGGVRKSEDEGQTDREGMKSLFVVQSEPALREL